MKCFFMGHQWRRKDLGACGVELSCNSCGKVRLDVLYGRHDFHVVPVAHGCEQTPNTEKRCCRCGVTEADLEFADIRSNLV